MNPLLADWNTPFGLPPFAAIATEDFAPAFEAALAEARANIDAIAADPEPPSFANTIEAMERAQDRLDRVAAVFFGLAGADTNDAIEALQRELSPRLAAHHAETMLNAALFARVDALDGAARPASGLTAEQDRVLTLYHRMFVRAGARLAGADRARLKAVMQRLASLGTAFGAERARRREGLGDAARGRTTSKGCRPTSSPPRRRRRPSAGAAAMW